MNLRHPLELRCAIQHYPWGKLGAASLVARLVGVKAGEDDSTPFAELWIGAHPKAPSRTLVDGKEWQLDQLIERYPDQLLAASDAATLPFLCKVISVREPLSIQAHPSREQAELLHARDPGHYPDPYPKPEIAIARTPVSVLHGFRPVSELVANLERVPELRTLVGDGAVSNLTASVKDVSVQARAVKGYYQALMRTTPEAITKACGNLVERLKQTSIRTAEDHWVLKLAPAYPAGDIGLFHFYLLNLSTVPPRSTIFTATGIPHAYLDGDLVECMANSDNVVRGGLTEKHREVEALLQILDYTPKRMTLITAEAKGPLERILAPGCDFVMDVLHEPVTNFQYNPSAGFLTLCLEGKGYLETNRTQYPFSAGVHYFVPAACGPVMINTALPGAYYFAYAPINRNLH